MANNIPILGVQNKPHSRINYKMGIIYYEDNLYWKDDMSCWGVYRIKEYSYEFEGVRGKKNLQNKLTRLFWNIADEFQLIDIPIETSVADDHEQLKKLAKGNLRKQAISEIDETTEYLIDMLGDKGNKYETYLIIKYKNIKTLFRTLKEFGECLIQDPVRLLNKFSGLDKPEIYKREYEIYKQVEDITFEKTRRQMDIEKVNEYDIQKLIKYIFFYGIGAPQIYGPKPKKTRSLAAKQEYWKPKAEIISKNGKEYIRPIERQLLKLAECDIDIGRPRSIEIKQFYKGRERIAYQAYIAVSDMIDLPEVGGEWHYALKQNLNFPVYTSIRGKIIENKIARDELNRKKREIDDQEEHIRTSQNAQVPLDLLEKIDDAAIMENDLKANKYPLIYTSVIIVVAADALDELAKRIDAVKSVLDPIPCEVPAGDQWLMMNEAMIGGEIYQRDYTLRLSPYNLARIVPGASIEIGDETGFYLGITGSLKKPVRIGPWIPSMINKPPNITFTGTQGGGKSFTADLVTLKTAKYTGAKSLIVDPKGDRTRWPELFLSFGDEIQVTTFTSNKDDFGKLDPYIIMKSGVNDSEELEKRMKEASIIALDITMFFLGFKREDPRTTYLFEAAEMAEKSSNPSMIRIIEFLKGEIYQEALENDDKIKANLCREMASTLNSYKNMAYAGLLFGQGDEKSIDFEKQINVLQIQNLTFPAEGKTQDEFDFQETIGYACLLAMTGYIKKFIMGDRKILKIFLLDEAKVLNATPAGRSAMNTLHRMARALNVPGCFIGQSVEDVGDEKVRNNIGYKFAFKTTELEEIKKVLKYYKLEESEENIELVSSLGNGICLFQDHFGRTAVVVIDYVFEEYLIGLNTTPVSEEELLASSGGE